MMPPIELGGNPPANKFKFCDKCKTMKPPEGGIDMGSKWNCQSCWTKRITYKNLNTKGKK